MESSVAVYAASAIEWAQGASVVLCVLTCIYVLARLQVLSRSMGVICDVVNSNAVADLNLEVKVNALEEQVEKHAKMLAHMAAMRAAKAAKQAVRLKKSA